MRAESLINRLDKVRPRGPGQWMCRCPAHQDRTASLSVKETSDGRILMYCFAGCGTDAILGALGMEMTDLMPERIGHMASPVRHKAGAADILRALERELTVVAVVASDMESGIDVTPADWARFREAAAAIIGARAWLDE